jgi:glycine/D-amino acid oxidase-like deaminating enzyme
MQIDYLIIGQGISGTWLSYYLQKEKKSFIVIDNNAGNSPSRIAAGIINPVTGRRHVTVWMAEKILPFSLKAYNEIGISTSTKAISQKNIIDFFPSPQMRISFLQRIKEDDTYVKQKNVDSPDKVNALQQSFNYEFGFGEINPVYTVHLETLLPTWRKHLLEKNALQEETFDIKKLEIKKGGIQYGDINAEKIIFCDGNGTVDNPHFKNLPFAPNKGEALIVEIPDLPHNNIYKKGMMLSPLATPGLWWIGSNYAWEFDNENPTDEFRNKTEALLKEWLKLPFTIKEHLCGIRPATLERRPFVGIHPQHPGIGILNGMGTKGCSLAPYFARQLVGNLLYNKPISPEADINRFNRVLARQSDC